LLATLAAVVGISCIRPRAPTRLIASGAKALSWRTIANSSDRSAVPPLGTVVIG